MSPATRFGKLFWAKSQLQDGYTQFRAQELEGAKAAAERFIRLHPEHPDVDYATCACAACRRSPSYRHG